MTEDRHEPYSENEVVAPDVSDEGADTDSEAPAEPVGELDDSGSAEGGDADSHGSAEGGDADSLEPASPEDVASSATEFVSGLLSSLGLEAEVTSSIEGETATIEVAGGALGGLIGRRGQTLDALQEITRTAVQRRLKGRVRVLVDVEGYRARRRASLAEYARSIAQRAKERGTEIELEPMSAYERKVVHDAVAEIDGATSFSEGVEPNRKVVVRGE